jgi:hypothetical protein
MGVITGKLMPPVASWSTIQMMPISSSLLSLKSCQVNSTQAFHQELLDDTVYIYIPHGQLFHNGTLHQHENLKFDDIHEVKEKPL